MTTEPGSGTPMSSPNEPTRVQTGSAAGESGSEVLQSMLARVAEEQLGEQRELASAVGDIRNQVMRMSQELAEMRVRPRDETVDSQINHVTVEMREAVRFLSERLDGVTRMVAQRGEDLADIRTALTAIDTHVRSQAETVGVLSAGLQALPSYGERVSVLHDNVEVLHRQLVGIEGTLAAGDGDDKYADRLESIESSIAPLAERLESIESSLAPLGRRFEDASEIESARSALLTQLQTSASQVQQAVASLHNRIDPIASDLTAIGGDIAGLVEGTATGAALDSRISESVTAAVLVTEQRLTDHVDEAVLALAQTLLKRRVPAGPGQPSSLFPDEARSSTDRDDVGRSSPFAGALGDAQNPDDDEELDDAPTSVWRKGVDLSTDEPDLDDVSADDDGDEWASPGSIDDDDDDGDDYDDDDDDDDDDDEWASPDSGADDEGSVVAEEPIRGEVLESDLDVEEDEFGRPPAEADDVKLPSLAPMASGFDDSDAADEEPPREPWTPETPPERSDTDPTGPLPGKRKRRWGRR